MSLLVLADNEIRVHGLQCCMKYRSKYPCIEQGRWGSTSEVYFWRKKHQKGHGLYQQRSLFLVFVSEDGLIGAEASLALTEEIYISSMCCEKVVREVLSDEDTTWRPH